jgi:hypothetical protein
MFQKPEKFLKKRLSLVLFNNFSTMYCIIQFKTYIFVYDC